MKVVDGFKLICQNLGIPMFVVYWSETALEFCTGGDISKNIYIIKPDGRVEIKPYTKTEVKTLLEKGYFGYDLHQFILNFHRILTFSQTEPSGYS